MKHDITLKQLLERELSYLNNRLEELSKTKTNKIFRDINWWYFRGRKSAVLDIFDTAEILGLLEK